MIWFLDSRGHYISYVNPSQGLRQGRQGVNKCVNCVVNCPLFHNIWTLAALESLWKKTAR